MLPRSSTAGRRPARWIVLRVSEECVMDKKCKSVLAAAGEDFRLQCAPTASGLPAGATACAGDDQCPRRQLGSLPPASVTHHGPARAEQSGQKPSFGQSEECHTTVALDRSCAITSMLRSPAAVDGRRA
ncbi:hypothetical protein CTA2_1190 [Colletotrichum tanaceti]|uniref:Uncharacterized protein n=1 Tax=Colletotrichum tanaceti TaxID=1306861 RepID=A0A4U6WZP7_9PEZI|nr:hypothetical protein CTA2_1190 [Colletotrichum tanaceti]TKW48224.1 hypothetical protein CTA1_534 [Colletotrichum tanaceti]